MSVVLSISVIITFHLTVLVLALPTLRKDKDKSDEHSVRNERQLKVANWRNYPISEFLWRNGSIPFDLDSSLSPEDTKEVHRAIAEIEEKTCIRFQARRDERDYASIGVDNKVCGKSNKCRLGGKQYVLFGRKCRNKSTMIHELMHTLCFGHEHERPDRGAHVTFSGCAVPPRLEDVDFMLMNYPYDYYSRMHYQCGNCSGGVPTAEGFSQCGKSITPGLGVMDADKINDRYDCGGCLSHRWRLTANLTNSEMHQLLAFDSDDSFGESSHICRGYIQGDLVVGKFSLKSGFCHLHHKGMEHVMATGVQVLTLRSHQEKKYYYKLIHPSEASSQRLIVAGKRSDGVVGYVASSLQVHPDGTRERLYGTAWEGEGGTLQGYFPLGGKEVQIANISILACAPLVFQHANANTSHKTSAPGSRSTKFSVMTFSLVFVACFVVAFLFSIFAFICILRNVLIKLRFLIAIKYTAVVEKGGI